MFFGMGSIGALIMASCTTWSGDLSNSGYGEDDKKLLDQSYAEAVYIELPKFTDNDADKDFTPAIPNAARGYQSIMAKYCASKHVFAACVTQPAPSAFIISTDVTIMNYRPGSYFLAVFGGIFLPPILGMLWSFPVGFGDIEVQFAWTLKDPKGNVISTWTSHQDGEAMLDSEEAMFVQTDGFPKFLAGASEGMVAHFGAPRSSSLASITANSNTAAQPSPVTAPPPPSPRRPGAVVAVFDVQDASGRLKADLLDQLTEYLAAQIVEVARYRVVPRDQLRSRLLEEKKESYKGCYDESCQIELGKAVAAEESLQTKLLRVGSTCAITATLYDLKSETTDLAGSVDGDCSENVLMGNMRRLAEKLVASP
jgi:hypothetical protein